jgi:hypothetical protein
VTETLIQLLLRLSEAGEPARLPGRLARRYFGPDFDRLEHEGVLDERDAAEEWPTCRHCECGLEARPILKVNGNFLAPCPIDPASDAQIDVDDLRMFTIEPDRLVGLLSRSIGLAMPGQLLPGLWYLGCLTSGRHICLSLARYRPSMATVSCFRTVARGMPLTFLVPSPAALDRVAPFDESVHLVDLFSALVTSSGGELSLDPNALEWIAVKPRLLIGRSGRRVTLDGRVVRLSPQEFRLLQFFADQALKGPEPIDNRRIENLLWGEGVHRITSGARDPVRKLKAALAAGAPDPAATKALFQNTSSSYRLELAAEEIRITG